MNQEQLIQMLLKDNEKRKKKNQGFLSSIAEGDIYGAAGSALSSAKEYYDIGDKAIGFIRTMSAPNIQNFSRHNNDEIEGML